MKDRTRSTFDSAIDKWLYLRSLQAFDEARQIYGLPQVHKAPKGKIQMPACLDNIPTKKDD